MTNHCTPQTARALKDAGFNQPEQKPGQFWYLQDRLYIIVAILTDTVGQTAMLYEICQENCDPDPLPVRLPFSGVFVYAPGVGEIMQNLGQSSALLYDQDEFLPGYLSGFGNFLGYLQPHNESPADALGVACLKKLEASKVAFYEFKK
jgi:hypothetical protein